MEYFNLTQDNRYRHLPYIRNLRDILRREEELYIEGGRRIPDHNPAFISSDQGCDFPSILEQQIYLIREEVKEVFSLYDPQIRFKRFFLIHNQKDAYCIYYAPIFRQISCLSPESCWNRWGNRVERCVLDREAIGDAGIFRVEGAGRRIVVIRLDVAESLLRRGIMDFKLELLSVKG